MRQEGNKYNGFFQTLGTVIKEEGARGLYKGMATHLIRQIPNTAIVMTTYELVVNHFQYVEKSFIYAEEDEWYSYVTNVNTFLNWTSQTKEEI